MLSHNIFISFRWASNHEITIPDLKKQIKSKNNTGLLNNKGNKGNKGNKENKENK